MPTLPSWYGNETKIGLKKICIVDRMVYLIEKALRELTISVNYVIVFRFFSIISHSQNSSDDTKDWKYERGWKPMLQT